MQNADQSCTPIAKVAPSSNRGSRPGERRGGRTVGTPNKATGEVRELAKVFGPEAIEAAARLAGLVCDDNGNVIGMAESEQARLAAISIILDRAYGKAPQALTGEDGGAIQHEARVVNVVGIDRPPPETREEWLARQKRERAVAPG